MPTAIIIGFEYKFNVLTGALIDLYQAYSWCQSFDCVTHVITDISEYNNSRNIQTAIANKITDDKLSTFYDTISSKVVVSTSYDLMLAVIRVLEVGVPDNKLVMYYSGHGVKECMVMPDKGLLPFIDFRDNILSHLLPQVEIFWILDCCNPNGMHLPFKLENNSFVLSPTKVECVLNPILLITSSEMNEKSIATNLGSLFSRCLFRVLRQLNEDFSTDVIPNRTNRNLKRLVGNLVGSIRSVHSGYAQTVSMYSSYVTDPILWMWIGSNKDYDISIDMSLSTLVVRKHQPFRPHSSLLLSRKNNQH